MNARATIFVCSLLAPGCGPGPGGSTDSGIGTAGTNEATATGLVITTGTTSSTGEGSGGATGSTTGATTDTPTTGGTGTTTDATTGADACEGIVGSMDCEMLVAVSPDLTLEECQMCQGAQCGQIETCDGQYPCVDGTIVLRGCCTDDQCEGLTPFCGMFIGTDNVCVNDDDQ